MSANTATISALHADGVVKDGDKLLNYSYNGAGDTVATAYDVIARKHPNSGKLAIAIVKKVDGGVTVTDSTQYLKGAEFLRDLKPIAGVLGFFDAVVESIAALAMANAELTAAGTPVDSQLTGLPTGIDMAFETYTSNTKAGYLRAKAAVVTVAPYQIVAADTVTAGIDWNKVLLYTGIGTVLTIAGILIYKSMRKKPYVIRKK
jgi:hypothetical protein